MALSFEDIYFWSCKDWRNLPHKITGNMIDFFHWDARQTLYARNGIREMMFHNPNAACSVFGIDGQNFCRGHC